MAKLSGRIIAERANPRVRDIAGSQSTSLVVERERQSLKSIFARGSSRSGLRAVSSNDRLNSWFPHYTAARLLKSILEPLKAQLAFK